MRKGDFSFVQYNIFYLNHNLIFNLILYLRHVYFILKFCFKTSISPFFCSRNSKKFPRFVEHEDSSWLRRALFCFARNKILSTMCLKYSRFFWTVDARNDSICWLIDVSMLSCLRLDSKNSLANRWLVVLSCLENFSGPFIQLSKPFLM